VAEEEEGLAAVLLALEEDEEVIGGLKGSLACVGLALGVPGLTAALLADAEA
jgi:hypothetical protein